MTRRVAHYQTFLQALVPHFVRAAFNPLAFGEIWSSNGLASKLPLLTSYSNFHLYSASPQIGHIQRPISAISAAPLSSQLVDQQHSLSLGKTRRFSSRPTPVLSAKGSDRPILVRKFILDSLYNPHHGYFASQAAVVGKIPKAIEFDQLWGKGGYTKLLDKLYKEIGSSWLTPVELFQPWYGYALAEFIRQSSVESQVPDLVAAKTEKSWLGRKTKKRKTASHREAQTSGQGRGPLQIYEIGGGCGTCALNILDYFEQKAPDIYKRIKYTSVEISDSLAAEQRRTVYAKAQHRSKFNVEVRDAADPAGWGGADDGFCFVIMLEVLDNLPHDRVFRSSRHDPWLETLVKSSQPSSPPPSSSEIKPAVEFRELLAPVWDPLIKRCLTALDPGNSDTPPSEPAKANIAGLLTLAREFFGSIVQPEEGLEVLWLPTGALQLLDTLYGARPNMCLIAADFDQLPDVRIEGRNAPLAASKADGVTEDQSTYLVQPGSADIFFPTDFEALGRLNEAAARSSKNAHIHMATSASTRTFMEQFGDVKRTKTRTGYNPLLEDYLNTKFFVSHSLSRTRNLKTGDP